MTKTFETGSHVAVGAPPQSSPSSPAMPSAGEAAASKPPSAARSKAVYSAVCTTSACASTSGNAVLMSTSENHVNPTTNTNSLAEEDSVTNLDELKLRALLDEAITYKTPKDRETKSKLFNTLLIDAEDNLRKEHAHSASGPARHFSSTAKKRQRQRRQPSSVSENLTHGGSLNDLAKQELYEYESAKVQRPKTVSTRQREGGSLPCNVNAGAPHVDRAYFMEERARQQEQRSRRVGGDEHGMSAQRVGDHHLACADAPALESTFISKASIPIIAKVDDPLAFAQLATGGAVSNATHNGDGTLRLTALKQQPLQQHGLISVPKKLDENDNSLLLSAALGAGVPPSIASAPSVSAPPPVACGKRKSKQKKVTENVIDAEKIVGHRGDIIRDIDKLVSYIEGTEDKGKKKLHKQHSHTLTSEDKSKSKRQRKKSASMLQKSNSMEEMSTTMLEEFSCRFEALDMKEKAPLRPIKSNVDRQSRLHKAWVVSSEQLQMPTSSTSAENVEISDFIPVTKKKKSKKRRNSLGSRGDAPPSASETRPAEFHGLRVSSPRRKSASSAPHSEKSVYSSDNESVHSLPLDGDHQGHQISYADIAKSSERPKWSRAPAERKKAAACDEKLSDPPCPPATTMQPTTQSTQASAAASPAIVTTGANSNPSAPAPSINNQNQRNTPLAAAASNQQEASKELAVATEKEKERETDTDLSSLLNWPEIRNNKMNQAKTNMSTNTNSMIDAAQQTMHSMQDWPSIISNGAKQLVSALPSQALISHAKPTDNKTKKGNKQAQVASQQTTNERLQHVLQVQGGGGGVQLCRHNLNEDGQQQVKDVINNPHQVIQQVSEQSQQHLYQMPPNIRDVQSIEEMQIRSLQAAQMSPALAAPAEEEAEGGEEEEPEEDDGGYAPHAGISYAPVEKHRPAVVILSSSGDRHATSGITFGFGINEQLLSGDVCADFVSRFVEPEVSIQTKTQVDQLVTYVGSEWENIVMQTRTGKVKYYIDEFV